MLLRIKLLFIFTFHTIFLWAQINCDCKNAQRLKKFDAYIKQTQADSAELIINDLSKSNSPGCRILLNLLSAKLNYQKRDMEKTRAFLSEGKRIMNENKCVTGFGIHFDFVYGLVHFQTDKLDSSAFYLLKVVDESERQGDKELLARAYSFLAGVFGKMNQVEKAIFYLKRSIKLNEAENNFSALANNYSVLSTAYSSIFNRTDTFKAYFDSAGYAARQSVLFSKRSNNREMLLSAYNKIAGQYIFLKQNSIAERYLDSSIENSVPSIHGANLVSAYYRKADMFSRSGSFSKANENIDSSLKYALTSGNLKDIYALQFNIYKGQGDYKKALESLEKAHRLSDSLFTNEKSKVINELEQKYQKVENEKKISELNKENEIAALNVRFLAVGILATILIILVIIFFYRQSVLKNKFKALETEQRLNRARINPHFFFNVLASIQALSHDKENVSKVSQLISKFSKIMRQSLESTYDELTSIEAEMEFLSNYLDIQKARFPGKFDYNIKVDEGMEVNELKIPGMLLQPFIENSVEHGLKNIDHKGRIDIEIGKEDKYIKIILKDNGKGFDRGTKVKEYPSRAMQIINDRFKLLNKAYNSNARFRIGSNEGGGVSIIVYLPLIY